MTRSVVARTARAAAVCTMMLTASPARAQVAPLPVDAAPTFKSSTELVVLQVNVFDRRSDAVDNLPQSAFTVLEDEKPQDITFFTSADVPVAIGLVIDNSSSMITQRGMVLAGAQAFADSSHPEDALFAVVFNEHVRYGLPDGVDYTGSHDQVLAALSRYPPGGKTALYDAVIESLAHLGDAPHQKRVLIVLSDGGDNASRHTRQEMLDAAAASDALIYTIAKRTNAGGDRGDPKVMRQLADVSGGLAYFPDTEREVVTSFDTIAGNIRRGYSIGYVPATPGDGQYHRLKVMVRVPGRSGLAARARHGYASPRPDGAR